jgi:hypothetical protein
VKLCRGGGQEVTHSSGFANPHGSVGGDLLPEPPGLVHVVQEEERGGAEDERADRRDLVQHGDVPGQVRVVRDPAGGYESTVDSHVKYLRRKIEDDPGNPRIIQTV